MHRVWPGITGLAAIKGCQAAGAARIIEILTSILASLRSLECVEPRM